MGKLLQTFSEEEFKKAKEAEAPEIFNLNLIVPGRRLLIVGLAIGALICWTLAAILFFIKNPFVWVASAGAFIALRYMMVKQKSWEFESTIELYDDKIIIHEVKNEPIAFAEMRDYQIHTYLGFNFRLRLNNGKKILVWGNKNPATAAFAEAFRNKME